MGLLYARDGAGRDRGGGGSGGHLPAVGLALMARVGTDQQLEARATLYMTMAGNLFRKKYRHDPGLSDLLPIATLLALIDGNIQTVAAIEEMAARLKP